MSRSAISRLGEDDETSRHVQQPADVEVLAGLRHHRFVGRDDEHHEVDAADPGEHVLDEALVAGNVHERDAAVPSIRRQCANPRSIVMPRSCSSFSRSGSVPVSARTSALLP